MRSLAFVVLLSAVGCGGGSDPTANKRIEDLERQVKELSEQLGSDRNEERPDEITVSRLVADEIVTGSIVSKTSVSDVIAVIDGAKNTRIVLMGTTRAFRVPVKGSGIVVSVTDHNGRIEVFNADRKSVAALTSGPIGGSLSVQNGEGRGGMQIIHDELRQYDSAGRIHSIRLERE